MRRLPAAAVVNRILSSRPSSRRLTALALAIGLMALFPAVAAAKKHSVCGDQVVADWYDDGRVGKIYPLHCYRDAITSLPSDVIDYSNAKEEISRALAFAKQGKPDPGGKGHSTSTTPVQTTGGKPGGKPSTDKTKTVPIDTSAIDTSAIDTSAIDTSALGDTVATTQTDTSGPSSVPVPLIVLGGLAVVLLAAGSAGYLRRRSSGRDDDDAPPPASA